MSKQYSTAENEIRAWAYHTVDNERGKQTAALERMNRLLSEGLQALHRDRIAVTEERLEIVLELVTSELSRIQRANERSLAARKG